MAKMQKVAVVTGSAKGLGRALAIALSVDGYLVVVHYRNSKQDAKIVVSDAQSSSPGSFSVQADLTSENEVNKMFKVILKRTKRVDLLVNNVGDFLYKEFGKTTNAEFRNIVESNLYPSLFCSREVLKFMRKQKGGHIINIGTVGMGRLTLREKSTSYFIAKNALYYLTKMMAWEEAKNGIHINMVSPASLKTDIFKPSDFPMGRCAKYEDVVKAIKFLTSEDAYYINGANLEVAGAFIPGMG